MTGVDTITLPYREDPTWDEIRITLDHRYIGHVLLPRRASRKEKADAVHRFVTAYREERRRF